MSKYQTPCRYDFVGSFLRPEEVKKANADYQEGKISEAEKNQIIDKAVTEVVAKQKELGFHVITDGEFRLTGIRILCGDLKVSVMNRPAAGYSLMESWHHWKILI